MVTEKDIKTGFKFRFKKRGCESHYEVMKTNGKSAMVATIFKGMENDKSNVQNYSMETLLEWVNDKKYVKVI